MVCLRLLSRLSSSIPLYVLFSIRLVILKSKMVRLIVRYGLLIVAFIVTLTLPPLSHGASLTKIDWDDTQKQVFLFEANLDGEVDYLVQDHIEKSGYFLVDIKNISTNYQSQDIRFSHPLLSMVRATYYMENRILRLVFYVQRPVEFTLAQKSSQPKLLIRIFRRSASTPTPLPYRSKKVVVIDPGHGGVSSGAKSPSTINGRIIFGKNASCLRKTKFEKQIFQVRY